jgi:hypothetical protein
MCAVKKLCLSVGFVMLGVLAVPGQASAETAVRIIVSASAAPVFVKADSSIAPLRVAKVGSVLNVIAVEGEWYRIEFQDPEFGRSVGYIEKRHVNVQVSAPQSAVDLSIAEPQRAATKAQEQAPAPQAASPIKVYSQGPTLYINPGEEGFETYVAAAVIKKQVPVTLVTKEEGATYVLKAAKVEIQQQSTGSKIARCLFAYCVGMEDRGLASVQLMKGDAIVWSYSVNKGRGQKNRQALAEAIAKHMKDEVFSN